MLQGEDTVGPYDLSAVKPEEVVNLEAAWSGPGQRCPSGERLLDELQERDRADRALSEIGLPLRQNVDRSVRRGVEVDLTWQALPSLQVRHTAAYSYNRIRSWTQVYDVYDTGGSWAGSASLTHDDVVPLLTPAVLFSVSGEYTPAEWCTLGAAAAMSARRTSTTPQP